MEKHSLLISGHRTSVSLEREFWIEFQREAGRRDVSLNTLAEEIDRARVSAEGPARNLSSAIRVFVLGQVAARAVGDALPDGIEMR